MKDHIPVQFFWNDHLSRTFAENIIFPCIFLRKIILNFPSKVIFSGKRNTICPDNTRKITLQCNFFWKDHLSRTFEKGKYGFSSSGKISVLVYRKPTYNDHYLHCRSHHQTSCKESVVFSLFNRLYFNVTNKDDLTEENARIKQELKENGYQESIISNIFNRIANNHRFSP